jgi:tetratricopeptide (TPR) repeat protein
MWRRVAEIYDAIMERPPGERERSLNDACAGVPPQVRARVVELLKLPPVDDGPLVQQFERDLLALTEGLSAWIDGVPKSLPDFGPYERICYLGHGGMGAVYKAFDRKLGVDVALKTPLPGHLSNEVVVRIFHTEPRSMARLKHPHIVQVHRVDEHEGRPYFTMDWIDGTSLDNRLEELRNDPRGAAALLVKVARAIHHAHQRGVLHRDLKPANIFLDARGEPHVTDYGLAKQLGTGECLVEMAAPLGDTVSRVCRGIIGTAQYMSPEQANGKDVTIKSDVYGLGATLYALLTGLPPFRGQSVEDTLRLVRDEKPEPPGKVRRGLPPDLEAICLKCLEKEPEDRYDTAEDLADDLKRFLEGKPIVARPVGALRRLWMWARRRPAQALAASLAVLFLLAVLASVLINERARRRQVADTVARALTAANGGDLEAAEQAIAEAELAGASPGQVRMLRGQIALHRGQSREAIRHLEQAVRLLPSSVAAQGMLAAAYASDGQWEGYDRTMRKIAQLTPSTPEDFLFQGYAEANLDPARGHRTMQKAIAPRPTMAIARLLRAEVRAFLAQDTDDLEKAEGAVEDARFAREWLGEKNPAAFWVSLGAHLAKAGVHEHRDEPKQRRAELELAGKHADALKPFTALPEAVVYRWMYFREVGREEEVLEELRRASEQTDHVYVAFCCALTLYRRGQPRDLEEALHVLEKRSPSYNDRLLPFVLAEHDWPNRHRWPARALKASDDFASWAQDVAALMDSQAFRCVLGMKGDAVTASKALVSRAERLYALRREPLLRCLRFNAGNLSEDELVQGAKGSRWNQCLAHYYVAMRKLAEGDRKGAQDHFDRVVKTRAFIWGTYDLSWVFQARLAKDPKWPGRLQARRAR